MKRNAGLFQELVFEPKVFEVEPQKDGYVLHVRDDDHSVAIASSPLQQRFYRRYITKAGMIESQIQELPSRQLVSLLTKLQSAMHLQYRFLYQDKQLVGVTSHRHKQISWNEILSGTNKAAELAGISTEAQFLKDSYWYYQYPLESKYVHGYLGVDAGQNIGVGRAAIRLYSRIQTIVTLGNERVPCLNWAYWSVPTTFFNIDVTRLDSLATRFGGQLNVLIREVHIQKTAIDSKELAGYMTSNIEASKKVVPVIEEAVRTPLARDEMDAILEAYHHRTGIPKYVAQQVRDVLQEETVWGFSNALSYVRTHGTIRGSLDREMAPLTDKLERISGEVLSLAPTIKDLKEKVGSITLKVLLEPQKVKVPRVSKKAA